MQERGSVLHAILSKQATWRAARIGIRRHPAGACVGRETTSQVSVHVFSRSDAQRGRSGGVPIEDIGAVLYHKDINTTLLHYAYTDTLHLHETVMSYRVGFESRRHRGIPDAGGPERHRLHGDRRKFLTDCVQRLDRSRCDDTPTACPVGGRVTNAQLDERGRTASAGDAVLAGVTDVDHSVKDFDSASDAALRAGQ